MDDRACRPGRLRDSRMQAGANRVGETDVADYLPGKKCAGPPESPVNKLVGNNNMSRMNFLLHTTDCADRDNAFRPNFFEGKYIGAIIYIRGRNSMADAMPDLELKGTVIQVDDYPISGANHSSVNPAGGKRKLLLSVLKA